MLVVIKTAATNSRVMLGGGGGGGGGRWGGGGIQGGDFVDKTTPFNRHAMIIIIIINFDHHLSIKI